MELLIAQYLPLLIKYALVPAIAAVTRANPTITDAEIIAKLPADLQILASGNQGYLDSIRAQAGR
jgi:hypothetical protein